MLSQIPNLLTLLRIAACPVLVLVLNERNYELALFLFLAAGITDGLDGFIAKRFNYVTTLGAILDPLADKLLIGSAYIMLTLTGDLPLWLLIVVMFRDLIIIAGYLVLVTMGDDVPLRPSYTSKFNTFLQIALVILVLTNSAGWLEISWLIDVVLFGVLLTTIISGSQYVWSWGIKHDETEAQ